MRVRRSPRRAPRRARRAPGGGLGLFTRLALRHARRERGRTALVVAITAVPVAVVTFFLSVLAGLLPVPETALHDGAEAALVWRQGPATQESVDSPLATSRTDESLAGADVTAVLGRVHEVLPGARTAVLTELEQGVVVADGQRVLHGWRELVEGAEAALVPLADGRLPRTADEVVLPSWFVEHGDTVELAPHEGGTTRTVRVVGHLATGWIHGLLLGGGTVNDVAGDEAVVLVAGVTTGTDELAALNALGLVGPGRTAIAETFGDRAARGDVPVTNDASGTDELTALLAVYAAALAVVVGIVAPAHLVTARRRMREHALLAVVGAPPAALRRYVLLDAGLLGLLGALLGTALGLGALGVAALLGTDGFARPGGRLVVPAGSVALAAGIAVVAVTLAALGPARAAGRLHVVAVLADRRPAAPRRGTAPVGLLVTAGGVGVVALGTVLDSLVPVVAGAAACILGLTLVASTLLHGAARLAAPAGFGVRYALRESARQRPRSAAAVGAVATAVAVLVATLTLTATLAQHDELRRLHVASDDTIVVRLGEPTDAVARAVLDVVAATAPGAPAVVVRVVPEVAGGETGGSPIAIGGDLFADQCRRGEHLPRAERLAIERADPACEPLINETIDDGIGVRTYVDDGTWMAGIDLPGAEDAARALAAGRVVVANPRALGSPGYIHLRRADADDDATETVVPATVVPALVRTPYTIVLPPAVAARLGLTTEPERVLVSGGDRAQLANAVQNAVGVASVQRPHGESPFVAAGEKVAAASGVVGVFAALLVVLLVGAEMRRDLDVLGAVGAPPRTARALGASTAVTLVGLGTLVGAAAGLAAIWGYVRIREVRTDPSELTWGSVDPSWVLTLPGPLLAAVLLGVPLVAGVVAWTVRPARG